MVILFDDGESAVAINLKFYIPRLPSSGVCKSDSGNSLYPHTDFNIKAASRSIRPAGLGLLDAETPTFAAPEDYKSNLFAQRDGRNITQIGQPRNLAVALFDSNVTTVSLGITNSKTIQKGMKWRKKKVL